MPPRSLGSWCQGRGTWGGAHHRTMGSLACWGVWVCSSRPLPTLSTCRYQSCRRQPWHMWSASEVEANGTPQHTGQGVVSVCQGVSGGVAESQSSRLSGCLFQPFSRFSCWPDAAAGAIEDPPTLLVEAGPVTRVLVMSVILL